MAEIDAQKFKRENGGIWIGGANTSTEPEALPPNQFYWGINVDNKNGLVQTRDGWTPIIRSPSGKAQMLTHFKDCRNLDWLVWGVAGRLYASPFPFVQYRDLGIQLNPNSDFFTHTVVERGARRVGETQNGVQARQLMRPLRYLVVSDNTNKPVYWSGGLVVCTIDNAPIGQWLTYVNNRLFIGGGQLNEEIWWSDIADPISFYDIGFLADGGQFRLRSNVTGLCPTPDGQDLLAFEAGQTWMFKVSTPIKREMNWKETPGFQRIIFPDIGCLAGKSFVSHYGDLWWWSNRDLISFRRAANTTQEDELQETDLEMTLSREKFNGVKDNVVGISHNNYFLLNTPVNEIWAKNNSPISLLNQNTLSAWLGVWTGFRVAEFCSFTGQDDGEIYTFALSNDYDGQNRIWKLFNGTQKDGGARIKCSVEFRGHAFEDVSKPKRFRWFDLNLSNIWGQVDLKGWFRGFKGGYKQVLSKRMIAAEQSYEGAKVLQSRKVYSKESFGLEDCTSCGGAEGANMTDQIDYMFQIMLQWEGQMAVDQYRLVAFEEVEQLSGRCEEDETVATTKQVCGRPEDMEYQPTYQSLITPIYVTPDTNTDCDLCPGTIPDPPRTYTSEQSCTKICIDGTGPAVTRTGTATSQISQTDADNIALAAACALAESELVCTWTSTQSCTATCPPGTFGDSKTASSTYTSTVSQADADSNALAAACAAANAQLQCSTPEPLLVAIGSILVPGEPSTFQIGSVKDNGRIDTTFNYANTNASPNCIVGRAGQGGFVGGYFSNYDGTSKPALVRLNSDGTINTSFTFGLSTPEWNGTTVGQISGNPLGGAIDLDWGTDGNLAIGGYFNGWNGQFLYRPDKDPSPSCASYCNFRGGYLLINPSNGAILSTNFPGFGTGINGAFIVRQELGTSSRFIGGSFSRFLDAVGTPFNVGSPGRLRPSIAKLNFDGSLNETFLGQDTYNQSTQTWTIKGPSGNNFSDDIQAWSTVDDIISIPNNRLVVVGDFRRWGGIQRRGVALVDGTTGTLYTQASFPGISEECTAVTYHNGYIYVAERENSGSSTIYKFDLNGSADTTFNNANVTITGNRISKMFEIDGKLALIGGDGVSSGGVQNNNTGSVRPYTKGIALISLEDGSIDLNFRSSANWYYWEGDGPRVNDGLGNITSATKF